MAISPLTSLVSFTPPPPLLHDATPHTIPLDFSRLPPRSPKFKTPLKQNKTKHQKRKREVDEGVVAVVVAVVEEET